MYHGKASAAGKTPSSKSDSSRELESHYSAQFGAVRWSALRRSLLQPSELVALENPFAGHSLGADPALELWLSAAGCQAYRWVGGAVREHLPCSHAFTHAISLPL